MIVFICSNTTAENKQLDASYSALTIKEQEMASQLKELELKMKGVKEYFQEKERELHKKIEVGEVSRMYYEQLESEAQEKAMMADQERQKERQELTELRNQITEIEKFYSNLIKNTEVQTGDAVVSACTVSGGFRGGKGGANEPPFVPSNVLKRY